MDGGISNPNDPAPASDPNVKDSEYFLFNNSVVVILPTVAVVAALEPDTAANKVDPKILVCNNLPGK